MAAEWNKGIVDTAGTSTVNAVMYGGLPYVFSGEYMIKGLDGLGLNWGDRRSVLTGSEKVSVTSNGASIEVAYTNESNGIDLASSFDGGNTWNSVTVASVGDELYLGNLQITVSSYRVVGVKNGSVTLAVDSVSKVEAYGNELWGSSPAQGPWCFVNARSQEAPTVVAYPGHTVYDDGYQNYYIEWYEILGDDTAVGIIDGNYYIIYSTQRDTGDQTYRSIKKATSSGGWTTIDSGLSVGRIDQASSIIGGYYSNGFNQKPAFAYSYDYGTDLHFYQADDTTGSSWTGSLISDSEVRNGLSVQHVLNSDDQMVTAIAYNDENDTGLSIYWDGQNDLLEFVGDTGKSPNILRNAQGRPLIIYWDDTTNSIKYYSMLEEESSESSPQSESSASSESSLYSESTQSSQSTQSESSSTQTVSESSQSESSSESSASSSQIVAHTMGVPMMFPCVHSALISGPAMFHTFGSTESLTKGFIWSDSKQNEIVIRSPARYSAFSETFTSSAGNVWNFNKAPVFSMGDNIKTYIRAVLNPFYNSTVQDPSNIVKYLEYRIGNNSWQRLDVVGSGYTSAVASVEYHFKEIGSIPCQIRTVLDDGEIVYSKEKYVFVTTENETEVQTYLTSRTDRYTSDPIDSLGGTCSRTPVNISSKISQNEGMSIYQNYVQLDSAVKFPFSGYVSVGDEIISYNNKTYSYPYKLTGCIRGCFGTSPASHKENTKVRLITDEALFPHITETARELSDKTDYKCVCVKNVKSIESGDISMHFAMLPPTHSKEKISFAIEKSVTGNTQFSQEIVDKSAEPFVSSTKTPEIINLLPTVFQWDGYIETRFENSPAGFGYVSRRNIEEDDNYVFLNEGSIEGEVIYRFYNNNSFFTADSVEYNSSSIDSTTAIVSYRTGGSVEELSNASWNSYEAEEKEANTEISRDIKQYCKYLEIKIRLERKETTEPSPSVGDLSLTYWTRGYSRFIEQSGNETQRTLTIEGDHYRKLFDEFFADYPEETSAHLKPLIGNDRYIIQSTCANAVGHETYVIRFNQGLAFSFVPYQDCDLDEMVIFEKRIDWDNEVEKNIDLTLNLVIYNDDPEGDGKVIGSSSQVLSLNSKVSHASHRVFDFNRSLPLKANQKYWVYMYCSSDPDVKGEWRFRGSYDLLYGNPDENKMKIFDINNGIVKRSDVDDFAIGFTAIGKIDDILTGHHSENSTIYYRLQPEGVNTDTWEFTGINLTLSSPYNHPYRIGPYVHAMWKKNTDAGWHRFRPRKISTRNGTQFLAPSSAYKTINSNEHIIIRVEIDKILDSDSIEDIRGFGEFGLGTQPAIERIEAVWKQDLEEEFIQNIVTNWMPVPRGYSNAIKLSDIYSGWSDNLNSNEQFFVWIKRDYSEVENPVRDSGFTFVVNHGVERFYELAEYDPENWTPISEETPPSVPASITVPSSSNDGIYEVSWSAVEGATFYEVQESSSPYQTLAITSENSYIVSGKTDGSYTYRVRAINSLGNSEYVISTPVIVEIAVAEESSSSSSSSSSVSSSSSQSSSSSSSVSSSSESSSSVSSSSSSKSSSSVSSSESSSSESSSSSSSSISSASSSTTSSSSSSISSSSVSSSSSQSSSSQSSSSESSSSESSSSSSVSTASSQSSSSQSSSSISSSSSSSVSSSSSESSSSVSSSSLSSSSESSSSVSSSSSESSSSESSSSESSSSESSSSESSSSPGV